MEKIVEKVMNECQHLIRREKGVNVFTILPHKKHNCKHWFTPEHSILYHSEWSNVGDITVPNNNCAIIIIHYNKKSIVKVVD